MRNSDRIGPRSSWCWPVQHATQLACGSSSSARNTGAILIASGRVPNTTRYLDIGIYSGVALSPKGSLGNCAGKSERLADGLGWLLSILGYAPIRKYQRT